MSARAAAPTVAQERTEEALEDIPVRGAPAVMQVRLRGGRSVEVFDGDDGRVTLRSPTGHVELRITLTDEGPVLAFEQTDVTLSTRGTLTLDCGDLRVKARRDVSFEAGRDLVHDARGAIDVAGDAVRVVAREGDVAVEARGDARLDGARVLLNCTPQGDKRG